MKKLLMILMILMVACTPCGGKAQAEQWYGRMRIIETINKGSFSMILFSVDNVEYVGSIDGGIVVHRVIVGE